MNKDEIMAMKAGRELDALIAEKVMNGEKKTINIFGPKEYWHFSELNQPWADEWKPSEDISAAWEVVEKVRNETGYFCLCMWSDKWLVDFIEAQTYMNAVDHEVVAETAPLAICRAALMTV